MDNTRANAPEENGWHPLAEARQLIELAATVLERTANDTVIGRNTAAQCREYLEATREPPAALSGLPRDRRRR